MLFVFGLYAMNTLQSERQGFASINDLIDKVNAKDLPFDYVKELIIENSEWFSRNPVYSNKLFLNNYKKFSPEEKLELLELMREYNYKLQPSFALLYFRSVNWETVDNPDEIMVYLLHNGLETWCCLIVEPCYGKLNDGIKRYVDQCKVEQRNRLKEEYRRMKEDRSKSRARKYRQMGKDGRMNDESD